MPKIYTMYNRAARENENKIMDRSDNVDRLSFVDNAGLVTRFIQEGKNLAAARAQALRSGMYSGDFTDFDDDGEGLPSPVYQEDPVVTQPIIERASASLSAKKKAVHEAQSENDSESEKPNPTAVSSEAEASGKVS